MWVVKLGGSLATSTQLRPWLAVLAARRGLVLVPGGGPFADQVRQAQHDLGFDDATGHRLALLAMEQYGRALCAIQPGMAPAATLADLHDLAARGVTPVWVPSMLVEADPDLPRNWDLTSDALSAWLAGRLGAARLLLVKAAPLTPGPAVLEDLAGAGLVDPLLATYVRRAGLAAFLLSASDAGELDGLLAGRTGRAVVAVAPGPERLGLSPH